MEGKKRGPKPKTQPETIAQETPDYLKGIPQQAAEQPKATSPADIPSLPNFNPENVRPKMTTKVMPNVVDGAERKGIMSGSGASVNVYNKKTGRTVKMNEKAFNRIKRTNPYLTKTHG